MNSSKKEYIPKGYLLITIALFVMYIIAAEMVSSAGIFYLKVLGIGFLFLANIFIWYPFYLLKTYGKPEEGKSYLYTNRVVTRGVYSVVRHPQYLGYILFISGFMLIHQNLINYFIGTIIIINLYLQIKAEDNYCIQRFGREYIEYMEEVPRLNFVKGIIKKIKSKS